MAVGAEVGTIVGCVVGAADGVDVGISEGILMQHPHESEQCPSASNCPPTAMHDAFDE